MKELMKRFKKGFTLVELIVVIAIIGILTAVLVPSLTKYIDKANYSKDVQTVETLNTYLENNSLLYYDMEINSKEDVVNLLKAENPDKELNLTVKSKGYYIWYDIKNKEILLETYENIEKKSEKVTLSASARNDKSDRSCISEFFKGYYFLDEGDSSLYKVIEIIENLNFENLTEEEINNLSKKVENELYEALLSVRNNKFEKAYKGFFEYLDGLSIEINLNIEWIISISNKDENPMVEIGEKKCDHKEEYIKSISGYPASCTETGLTDGEICTKCGRIIKEQDVIPAKGHTSVTDEAVAPTCTETGLTEGSHCGVCGEILVKQETLPMQHALEHHDGKAATCTEIGWEAYDTCSNCNYSTYKEIAALGHDEIDHDAQAATCTEIGWEAYVTCSRCDHTTYKEIAALGHDDVHHNAQAATCTEKGWEAYVTCSRCDYTTYKEIAAKEHAKEVTKQGKAATCTNTGLTDEITCSVCKEILQQQTEIAALNHDLIRHEGKAATCTEKGYEAYDTCSRCEHTTYKEKAALDHDLIHHDAKDPTCTEKGYEAYDTCSRCDYTTYKEKAALDHNLVHYDAKEPTCTEVGWEAYDTCSRCDYTTYKEKAALDHDLVQHDAKEPTCAEVGWDAYDTCSRCDYSTYNEKEKLKHDYSTEWENDEKYHYHKCSKCGDIIDKSEHVPDNPEATEEHGVKCTVCHYEISPKKSHVHTADEIVNAQAATCTEDGNIKYYKCNCGQLFSDNALTKPINVEDTIIKAGHAYGEWIDEVPATCIKTGTYGHYHCEKCNKNFDADKKEINDLTIKVLNHTYGEWIDEVPATCTENGTKGHYHCEKCNKDFDSDKNEITNLIIAACHTIVKDEAKAATCTETGLTEGSHCSVCGEVLVAQTTTPATGHEYDSDTDATCNKCDYVRKVTVIFKASNGNEVYRENVVLNSDVSTNGINTINKYVESVSASDYQTYKEFLGWYDEKTNEVVTDFSKITEDKVFIASIRETDRTYNINIYYEDKDNAIANSTYLYKETIENYEFGTSINIKKQFQYNTTYLFYMSPKDEFSESDWVNLANEAIRSDENIISLSDSKGNLEILANITYSDSSATGTLELVVLCVQPAAIVSTVDSISWESGITINSNCEFYLTVEDALKAAENSKTEYIRIYGQGKKNINENAYLPDTKPTINGHSLAIGSITYTIPSYELDVASKYTLGSKDNNFTIESSDTVILPYARNDVTSEGYLIEENFSKSDIIHSYLKISEGTNLYVNGSLVVGGVVASYYVDCVCEVSSRAVIMNDGNIICNSGAVVKSYGYIKGQNGTLELKNGSTLIDVFKPYDYPGGSYSMQLSNAKIFPIQAYSFHNVSCEVKINYGATFKVYGAIWADEKFIMSDDITILGDGGMFELTDESGYILKSVEDTTEVTDINKSFISSNQNQTQREVLNIYGSFTDNSIKLKLYSDSDLLSISTSKSMAMPIGMMKIILNEGEGKLNSVSYIFLPGSELIINEGATLTIAKKSNFLDSNVNVVFYDSTYDDSAFDEKFRYSAIHSKWFEQINEGVEIWAKLIVNGYLNVEGNLGGKIDSVSSDGKLCISNNYAETREFTEWGTVRAGYDDKRYYANGIINGSEANFSNKTTYYYNSDKKYWSTVKN